MRELQIQPDSNPRQMDNSHRRDDNDDDDDGVQ